MLIFYFTNDKIKRYWLMFFITMNNIKLIYLYVFNFYFKLLGGGFRKKLSNETLQVFRLYIR